jgi:hypothetical protein
MIGPISPSSYFTTADAHGPVSRYTRHTQTQLFFEYKLHYGLPGLRGGESVDLIWNSTEPGISFIMYGNRVCLLLSIGKSYCAAYCMHDFITVCLSLNILMLSHAP